MKHPAKYSDKIIEVIGTELPEGVLCYDPFAGVGKIFDIITWVDWVGTEIEPEWAELHPLTLQGDIFKDIPSWWNEFFDFVVTSCSYGNRLSDHHNAQDGSTRHSYKHYLGRDLHPANSGQIPWGERYRNWHRNAWPIIVDTLQPGGKLILNVSNHIKRGAEQHVWEWHVEFLINHCGLQLKKAIPVDTPRMREGKNYKMRVNCEYVFVFKK